MDPLLDTGPDKHWRIRNGVPPGRVRTKAVYYRDLPVSRPEPFDVVVDTRTVIDFDVNDVSVFYIEEVTGPAIDRGRKPKVWDVIWTNNRLVVFRFTNAVDAVRFKLAVR